MYTTLTIRSLLGFIIGGVVGGVLLSPVLIFFGGLAISAVLSAYIILFISGPSIARRHNKEVSLPTFALYSILALLVSGIPAGIGYLLAFLVAPWCFMRSLK